MFKKYHSGDNATIDGKRVTGWTMYDSKEVDPVFFAMLDALEAVQCECTILERISGHKTNCYMPQVQRALAKATGDL